MLIKRYTSTFTKAKCLTLSQKAMKYLSLLIYFLIVPSMNVIDFSESKEVNKWQIVNDGVMGGLSKSSIEYNENGNALFSGTVSLANNGGFASVQRKVELNGVSEHNYVDIRLKGDGKRYQFRLKHDTTDYASYIQYFETSGEWETIRLALTDFYPSFRGRKLAMDKFNFDTIEQITFLIANGVEEDFALEVAWIKLAE